MSDHLNYVPVHASVRVVGKKRRRFLCRGAFTGRKLRGGRYRLTLKPEYGDVRLEGGAAVPSDYQTLIKVQLLGGRAIFGFFDSSGLPAEVVPFGAVLLFNPTRRTSKTQRQIKRLTNRRPTKKRKV